MHRDVRDYVYIVYHWISNSKKKKKKLKCTNQAKEHCEIIVIKIYENLLHIGIYIYELNPKEIKIFLFYYLSIITWAYKIKLHFFMQYDVLVFFKFFLYICIWKYENKIINVDHT